MLDHEEYDNLSWTDTVALLEKKRLNVAAEIVHLVAHNTDPELIALYINDLCIAIPSIRKYKEDIEKYLLLM